MKKQQREEELLKEAEWAEKHIPDHAVPALSSDGFEKIVERVEKKRVAEEREKK